MQTDRGPAGGPRERPTCMVVDDDPALLKTLQVILGKRRIGPSEFHNVDDIVAACAHDAPDVLFLDIALQGFDAIDVLRALGDRRYRGAVMLVSGLHSLIDQVMRVGEREGIEMLPPLAKPFRAHQVEQSLRDFADRHPPRAAAT